MHIGKKIKETLESRDMKLKEFAAKVGVARQNIYRIFEKESLDSALLSKISLELDHDFFQYYRNEQVFSEKDGDAADKGNGRLTKLSLEVKNLKNELRLAHKEIDYLKKIIALMEDRTALLLQQKDQNEPQK